MAWLRAASPACGPPGVAAGISERYGPIRGLSTIQAGLDALRTPARPVDTERHMLLLAKILRSAPRANRPESRSRRPPRLLSLTSQANAESRGTWHERTTGSMTLWVGAL